MNSIPLTAPDGTVYAYACGECKRVYVGYGAVLTDRVADSRVLATKCCLCLDCKAALSDHYKGSPSAICTPCHQKRRDAEAAAQLKRVEKSLNPEAALELLEEMESYCRDSYYGNAWLDDIEFDLHESVEAVLSSGSQSNLYRGHGTQVRMSDLRDTCGGWWTKGDSDDEPRFVTTAEWLGLVAARQRHKAKVEA